MPSVITDEFTLAFPTVIWHEIVANHGELNPALLDLIREKRGVNPSGLTHSNIGGWHSERDLFEWVDPSVEVLLAAIHRAVKRVYAFRSRLDPSEFSMVVRTDGWANVNGPGDYNRLHVHPNSNWSGVYYVDPGDADDPKSGRLEFLDPRNRPGMFQSAGTDREDFFCLTPKPGLLVLFPSWLYHTASPYRGTRERVSIAFNTVVREIRTVSGGSTPEPTG